MGEAASAAFPVALPRPGGRPGAVMPHIPEVEACVHCGLCLNQCPTYRVTRLEAESPRGRIYLIEAAAGGRLDLTAGVAAHLYLCLACRACETACPSGVQYGRIAEAAREVLGPPGAPLARAITRLALRHLMPHPGRLRLAGRLIGLYHRSGLATVAERVLPERLRRRAALLPQPSEPFFAPHSEPLPAVGERRARVAFLGWCAMSLFFAPINEATVRVLRRNGCDVIVPRGQTCCGALNSHYGEAASARAMARRNIDAFPTDVDAILTNAAGCGAAMKEYGHLLKDDPVYAERAAAMAYRMAGIAAPAEAIQFAEVDDTYAYKELQHLEALGLCEAGRAGPMTADGATQPGGRLPVNTSGGSLGGGHLLEAAGLARTLEVVLQLRGQAGARQLRQVTTGLAQSWRGVPTASGAVVVLSADPAGRAA
ncbi:MAG: 4Fe-4S dicluster domain-containing protein [Firmicutes bacterium]|nr:4Fe-4S dicluster domain-containing protein [Bacillota bacterium]